MPPLLWIFPKISPLELEIWSLDPIITWIYLPLALKCTVLSSSAEAPIFWPHDAKSQLNEKTLMLGKIEERRRRGWQKMRRSDGIISSMGHGFEQTLGDSGGQRSLVRYGPWSWNRHEWMNNNNCRLGFLSLFLTENDLLNGKAHVCNCFDGKHVPEI